MEVEIQIASRAADLPDRDMISAWINRALALSEATPATELTVRIVDADESKALNRQFRGRDAATNVLSFPPAANPLPEAVSPTSLGDIVICAPLVQREAGEQGKAAADHWAHLLIHGVLHLQGFDHETVVDAAKMETLEIRILNENGVANPYADHRRDEGGN